MPEDANLELLEIIHGLQAASTDSMQALDIAVDRALANSESTIQLPVVAGAALASLLAIQNKLITTLIETNQEIGDSAERIAKLLS